MRMPLELQRRTRNKHVDGASAGRHVRFRAKRLSPPAPPLTLGCAMGCGTAYTMPTGACKGARNTHRVRLAGRQLANVSEQQRRRHVSLNVPAQPDSNARKISSTVL